MSSCWRCLPITAAICVTGGCSHSSYCKGAHQILIADVCAEDTVFYTDKYTKKKMWMGNE